MRDVKEGVTLVWAGDIFISAYTDNDKMISRWPIPFDGKLTDKDVIKSMKAHISRGEYP